MKPELLAAKFTYAAAQAQKALDAAAAQAAKDVAYAARVRAPVRTGRLRAGISVDLSGNSARVVSLAPYSVYVELGTLRASARPYLMPAYRAHDGDIRKKARAFIREAL